MSSQTTESLKTLFISLDKENKGFLTRSDFETTSIEIKIEAKALDILFKDQDKLMIEDFLFYFNNLHSLNKLDYFLLHKIKALNLLKKLGVFFKNQGPIPESFLSSDINSAIFCLIVGEELKKYKTKLRMKLNFKEKNNFSLHKYKIETDFVVVLKFEIAQENEKSDHVFQEFQKLFKKLLIVGKNLNKTIKEILNNFTVSYSYHENKLFIILKSSEQNEKFLASFIDTINSFFSTISKEKFYFSFQTNKILSDSMESILNSPSKGLIDLFNELKIEFSGWLQKINTDGISLKIWNFAQKYKNFLSFFLLLKSFKGKIILNSFTEEDLIYIPFLNNGIEILLGLGQEKITLPKMPILVELIGFCEKYLMSKIGIEVKIKDFEGKITGRTEKLNDFIKKIINI